jgi:hypothetical protein
MTRRISTPAAAALWLALGATSVQAAETENPCVPPDEAAALMITLAPDAVRAVGAACAQALPPTALVRQTSGPFLDKYQAEADASWPKAKLAIDKIAGGKGLPLDPDAMRPIISALILPAITKGVKAKDCVAVDHIVALLAPLPPRNVAELLVTILELKTANEKPGKKSDVPICPAAGS